MHRLRFQNLHWIHEIQHLTFIVSTNSLFYCQISYFKLNTKNTTKKKWNNAYVTVWIYDIMTIRLAIRLKFYFRKSFLECPVGGVQAIGCTYSKCGVNSKKCDREATIFVIYNRKDAKDASLTCDFDVDIISFHVAWLDGERSDASNWRQIQTFADHRYTSYIKLADWS